MSNRYGSVNIIRR